MLKRLLIVLLPLSTLAQKVDANHQLLWEISGNGLKNKSYVFGSFHSNDKRLFNLSDSTYFALQNAEVIVLETDIFSLFSVWDTRTSSVNMEYDNEGNPYITEAAPSETYYGNEDGMPQFLDAFFQQYCYNAGKKFVALESVDFQLNLASDIQPADFRNFKFASMLTDKEEMLEMYLKGDIYKLDEKLRSSLAMYPQGYSKLITERNFGMAEGLDSLYKEGKSIFCAVGAGHLAGTSGLISLLRGKGYTVRRVVASYSENPTKERKNVFAKREYCYDNDSLGLHVRFPGKPLESKSEYDEYELKLIYRDFGQGNSFEVEIYPLTEEIGLQQLASMYIASPAQSPVKKIQLDSGGEAYEGLADSYPEGLYWVRIIMDEEHFVIIKAYGGNKFMNSKRPERFFQQVWLGY